MSQLIQMRQRIKAIETIQKITHAMQLISMSVHLRLRDKKNKLEQYQATLKDIATRIRKHVTAWENPVFFPTQKTGKTLLILIGSQKGLCGSFNTTLFYEFEKDIKTIQTKDNNIISVGKKTTEYLANLLKDTTLPLRPIAAYNEMSQASLPTIAHAIMQTIIQAKDPYSKVVVYSNYPAGFFVQRQQMTTLIPQSADIKETPEKASVDDFVWEDTPLNIIETVAQQELFASLYYLLMQSLLAEQAARFVSMDNATRNAKYLKETMQLQYNKLRQAKITKELTELSSSFHQDFGA